MKRSFALAVVLTLVLAVAGPAHAALVDWDTLTWAQGSLSNTYDLDPSPGNDVTISMSGNTGTLTNDANTGTMTPAITMSLTGGLSPTENSLQLAADLHTNSKITFAVDFSSQFVNGVAWVSFKIFDIDLDTNNDKIRTIYGIALDGSHVAATITNVGSAVSLTGIGLSQVLLGTGDAPDTGPGSSNGNATISFGATPIVGFSFIYANGAGGPKYQEIAISDIFFLPIPEIDPAAFVVVLCGLAGLTAPFKRKQAHP
jgi:hypothetical protein